MKKFPCVTILAFCVFASAFGKGGTVHVRAYTRKDGTYVSGYDRSAPGSHRSGSSASYYSPIEKPAEKPFSVAPQGPTRFVPTYDPVTDPNWVPAKIRNGQYIAGHFKGDAAYAAVDRPLPNIPWRPDPPNQSTYRFKNKGPSSSLRSLTAARQPTYGAAKTERDAHGRLKRSESAKRDFMRMTGYPNGRPGYVVDHIIPLKRGGADDPSNMQWQTVEEAKAKDRWE